MPFHGILSLLVLLLAIVGIVALVSSLVGSNTRATLGGAVACRALTCWENVTLRGKYNGPAKETRYRRLTSAAPGSLRRCPDREAFVLDSERGALETNERYAEFLFAQNCPLSWNG